MRGVALLPMWLLAACTGLSTASEKPTEDTAAGTLDRDADGDPNSTDCAPTDPDVHSGAVEVCDGVDNDCDGVIDQVVAEWHADADGDGFGVRETAEVDTCSAVGFTATFDDCDDADPTVFPGAEELCNDVDDDCDGERDDGVVPPTWYVDADGDGVGVDDGAISACAPGAGWASVSGDCDDSNASIYVGAEELCDAGDNDCDGVVDNDASCPCDMEYSGGHAYLFCSVGSDWTNARSACEAVGYHLVTVDDATEDAWLSSTASAYATGYWWTGANDQASEGVWTWASGDPWAYSNFCPGEPNNAHGQECVPTTEEDCGVLSWGTGGCWNDYPCDCASAQGDPYRYICESG